VRRYLRELRALTEGYSFEFNQAKKMDTDLDTRAADERAKLEALFDEGKKISYLFETQSRAPENADRFESHSGTFSSLSDLSSSRSQVAGMIAQVLGNRTERLPSARIEAMDARPDEIKPIAMTPLKRASRAPKAKPKEKARKPSRKKGKPVKASKPVKQAKAKEAGKPARKGMAKKATGKKGRKGKN